MAKQNKGTPERKKRQPARVPKLKSLGKYQIQKEIGAGGMGAVFLARDSRLNRLAALKVLPRDKAENPVLVKRFKAEGQAAAHLRHDNIVSVYDAGEEDGYLYIALEYIDGRDLHDLITKEKRIDVRRSLEIVTQVTRALAHAFDQGIVHRDIKPANILIRHDGVVKLTDLGLARSIDDNTETSITRAGTTVGTVDYMAPEQARDSKAADIRSDLYSLGCTWYHMLTGRAPFSEGSLTNKLAAHATTPPPDPRALNDRVSEGMVAIMHRMMAKSQKDRYQTPNELLEDLKNSNLKRSNVDNNVLEALANDDSNGEQVTIDTNIKQAAESSDFLINQFIPDYSQTTNENENEEDDETANHISTSFDLQKLAEEVTHEPEINETESNYPTKPRRRSVEPEPISNKKRNRSKARREAPEAESGSVISDSAMKARKSTRTRKREFSDKRQKPVRPIPENKKKTQKESAEPRSSRKSTQKKSQNTFDNGASTEKQISIDYKRIAMIIGGVILLILLVLLGMKSFSSSNPGQPGSGNNPFTNDEQKQENFGNQNTAVELSQETSDEQTNAKQPVEFTENEIQQDKKSTDQTKRSKTTSQNITVRGQERKLLPAWGTGFSPLTGLKNVNPYPNLPVLKVTKNKTKKNVYHSLDKAIDAVTAKGALIRLIGQGPFLLNTHQIQKTSQLIIMADSKQDPVVMLQANESEPNQSVTDIFSFSAGLIRFEGIHFLCDSSQLAGSGVCNIFRIDQSDLTFQNCSFSLIGESQSLVRLIYSTGDPRTTTFRPQGEARIFLENSVITGNKLEPIRVDQAYADVLISNCFISTKGAPCLEVANSGVVKNKISLLEKRSVPFSTRIFSSTLLSDHSIIELNGPKVTQEKKQLDLKEPPPSSPPQTEIIVINSVLIGDPEKKTSSVVSLINWPLDKLREKSKNRFKGLIFQLDSTLLWGWPHYLTSTELDTPQNVFYIDSHRTWQQSWGKVVAARSFTPEVPPKLDKLRTPALVKPLLDFSKQKAVHAISKEGIIAGCDPEVLNSISQSHLTRIKAFLDKPQIENQIKSKFATAKTVTFDMTKRDLAEFLSSSAISGPTNVIVSGQGTCYTTPIVLENKQVRLQFQQQPGNNPLLIELKLSATSIKKRTRKQKSTGIDSFITLRNSSLDLVGGRFRISTQRRGLIPKHFVVSQNSLISLKQCELNAVLINDKRFQSVVYVDSIASGQMNQILIDHSYLATTDTIIESHSSKLNIDIQNSLLLSETGLFTFENPRSKSSSIKVLLTNSTFASGNSMFVFRETEGGTKTDRIRIQFFVDESIFMPAPPTSSTRTNFQTTSLFSIPQGIRQNKNIQWWGNSNGFMIERLNTLAENRSDSRLNNNATFSKEMAGLFGKDANQRTLAQRGGIILQEEKLPPLIKINPIHFRLLPNCKAASWSDLKQPIGANLAELENLRKGNLSHDKTGRIKRAF